MNPDIPMKFERDEHSPQEILMNALSEVEGAKGIAILIDKGNGFICRSNVEHRDLHWLLEQAKFMTMAHLFDMRQGGEGPE